MFNFGNPPKREVMKLMRGCGLADFELVRSRYELRHYGDAEIVMEHGDLVLRVVRDMGQEYVDLASSTEPERFYQFDHVEIAMGWKSLGDLLAKTALEPLRSVFERIARHRAELEVAFSPQYECATRERLEAVKRAHREARGRPL